MGEHLVTMNISDLPKDKFDIEAAEKIVEVGMPAIEPILMSILEWMADCNWPVAGVFYKVFSGMGLEIVPHIKKIFSGHDDIWKYWMIVQVVPQLSQEAKLALCAEIKRIAVNPTKGEITEEVALEAKEYLAYETFKIEVEKFRVWASDYSQKEPSVVWEFDYEEWSALKNAFVSFTESKEPADFDNSQLSDLVYVIARDNDAGELIKVVALKEELFERLLTHAIDSIESDAKWQFAVVLGNSQFPQAFAESALLKLVYDEDEYTRRRALQSLGKIGCTQTESLCIKAWETNHEHQRIMALQVLKEIESKVLSKYLELALADGREYVVQNANDIYKQLEECSSFKEAL